MDTLLFVKGLPTTEGLSATTVLRISVATNKLSCCYECYCRHKLTTCARHVHNSALSPRCNPRKKEVGAPFQDELDVADAKDKEALSLHLQAVDKVRFPHQERTILSTGSTITAVRL